MTEPLRLSFEVQCPAPHAFDTWTRRIGTWWPADRADATDVLITFVSTAAASTRVDVEHTGWERLGTDADRSRDANRGGWTTLLPHFVAEARREP